MASKMKLKNVDNGTMCRHTGTMMVKDGKIIGTRFPQDKGIVFWKLSDARQQAVISKEYHIFGANDMVEVIK